jgi:hypothetical protein
VGTTSRRDRDGWRRRSEYRGVARSGIVSAAARVRKADRSLRGPSLAVLGDLTRKAPGRDHRNTHYIRSRAGIRLLTGWSLVRIRPGEPNCGINRLNPLAFCREAPAYLHCRGHAAASRSPPESAGDRPAADPRTAFARRGSREDRASPKIGDSLQALGERLQERVAIGRRARRHRAPLVHLVRECVLDRLGGNRVAMTAGA